MIAKVERFIQGQITRLIDGKDQLKLSYLKLAKLFSTYGFRPLLTQRPDTFLANWAQQKRGDAHFTPENYLVADDVVEKMFSEVLPALSVDAKILEIGCNAGRSLNYLFSKGFKNLTGVEIGAAAIEEMKACFPEMYKHAKIHVGNAPEILATLPSFEYDLVFCRGVLVNIPSKYNYIFREMARISRKYILLIETEGAYLGYPRDFQTLIERHRFKMIGYKYMVPSTNGERDVVGPMSDFLSRTLRLFVRMSTDG